MEIVNVCCPECPPEGTTGTGKKRFLPFSHGRDLVAFHGTGLYSTSHFTYVRLGRDKQGLNPFGTSKMTHASGPIHYASTDLHGE